MKVLFLNHVYGAGSGGHYRSLGTTVEALSNRMDCVVVSIGPRVSPAVESAPARKYFIPFTALGFVRVLRELSSIVKKERPDVINSFDINSHFFGRLMGIQHHLPIVHTKCGGVNPTGYFPHADGLVLYSRENLDFFRSMRQFANTPIRLIPNRVKRFECDPRRVQAFRERLSNGQICFLRINRIYSYYEQTMMQCIALVRRLNQDGYPCQLAIVGKVQEMCTLERIRACCDESIQVFTDDCFSSNARDLIDAADIVVGTGRGFMEAACRGKVLMAPLAGEQYPLLVSTDTFDEISRTNFSERSHVEGFDAETQYRDIVKMLVDPDERERLQRQSRGFYEKYFNVDNAVEPYVELLGSVTRHCGIHVLDLILNARRCVGVRALLGKALGGRRPRQEIADVTEDRREH